MAENQAAWGIEIGNAGLKALKMRFADVSGQAMAVAFDYVPHEKLLSLPDANPEEQIRASLGTFLKRNQVLGDLVAISLPGKDSIVKFVQLPPVDVKKVGDIVTFEAKQQIPFPLEEVYWDWQPMGNSGAEAGGFLIDAEVGIFGMKRDLVQKQIQPYHEKKIELELIQVGPMALYNFVAYDRLGRRVGVEEEGGEFTVILDMGCDATNLMVTNGKKTWTRNVSIGGNHFTRALTKEMKLTFAKAEHLKCNATKSPDPRAVFQAMKPVFNDFVTEVQRSINAFQSLNRSAKVARLVGVGNGFRLAGLQKYLQQNLQHEVDRIESFNHLVGDNVLAAPLFQENILTFAVPYGLALQALGQSEIRTTLLPPDIVIKRKIRMKKPWAVVAAASLLGAFAISTFGYGMVHQSVSEDKFRTAEEECQKAGDNAKKLAAAYTSEEGVFKGTVTEAEKLFTFMPNREQWLEVYRAINETLPRDIGLNQDEQDIEKMHRVSINSVTAQRMDNFGAWFAGFSEDAKKDMAPEDQKGPPAGKGFLFTIPGYHNHKGEHRVLDVGAQYLKKTYLANLQSWKMYRENPQTGQIVETPIRPIGISHAVVAWTSPIITVEYNPSNPPNRKSVAPPVRQPGGFGGPGFGGPGFGGPGFGGRGPIPNLADLAAKPAEKKTPGATKIDRTDFVIQFAWIPTPLASRPAIPEGARIGTQPGQTAPEPVKPAEVPPSGDPATPATAPK